MGVNAASLILETSDLTVKSSPNFHYLQDAQFLLEIKKFKSM